MVDATIQLELSDCLSQLPIEQQRLVLEFARSLNQQPPKGVAGSSLLRFAGSIDEASLDAMSKAIEDGCERIDSDEW